ncbi:MAG: CBS domain-containing protein [Planctomycetes bacterium]|nr:CBS domain-containing protein [Planctomycetota bacterium]
MDIGRNLKIDSVARLHPTTPWHVHPMQTVADAVALMRAKSVGCVLVCLAGKIVGIFTERDLMRRVMSQGKPLSTSVGECMTPGPVTVDPKDPIGAAVRRMEEGGYRHLPVVHDGKAVGILSVKRIVHYLVEHFPATVHNQPPTPPFPPKREGA